MNKTDIEWADFSWNPATGCTKVSPGCDRCYAENMANRFAGGKAFPKGFKIHLRQGKISDPLKIKKPSWVFVNSMSDLFHKEIPDKFIDQVFETMEAADWHLYLILTKRSSRMRNYVNKAYAGGKCPAHIFCGVSIEDRTTANVRLRHLRETNAQMKMVSCEPLLEDLGDQDFSDFNWVIVGGESGRGARPMHPDWARRLRDQCKRQRVAFFFKQWGGSPKRKDRELDGEVHAETPLRPPLLR